MTSREFAEYLSRIEHAAPSTTASQRAILQMSVIIVSFLEDLESTAERVDREWLERQFGELDI